MSYRATPHPARPLPLPPDMRPPSPYLQDRRLRSRRGMTFIEILIVMIIIGAIAGLSFNGLRNASQVNRVKRAARLVAGDLQYAFSLAGARRTPVVIRFNASAVRYTITNRTGDTTYFTRVMGTSTPFQMRSGDVAFTPTTLTVFPSGLAADTLSVRIGQGEDTSRVWLARGGTTRIY